MYETKSKNFHGHKVYYSVGPSTECKVTKPYDRMREDSKDSKPLQFCVFSKGKRHWGCLENTRQYAALIMPETKQNRTFNEIIRVSATEPVKFYADLDLPNPVFSVKTVIEKFLVCFESALPEQFKVERCYFSDSTRTEKLSLHFVYDGEKTFRDLQVLKAFASNLDKLMFEHKELVTWQLRGGNYVKQTILDPIYHSGRQFRTIGCRSGEFKKRGKPNHLKPLLHKKWEPEPLSEALVMKHLVSELGTNKESYVLDSEPVPKSKQVVASKLIQEVIRSIPNTKFQEQKGNLIILRNDGIRKCTIGGELNSSDNSFLTMYSDRITFSCHDANCQGELVVRTLGYTYEYIHECMACQKKQSRKEIQKFCKDVVTLIKTQPKPLLVFKSLVEDTFYRGKTDQILYKVTMTPQLENPFAGLNNLKITEQILKDGKPELKVFNFKDTLVNLAEFGQLSVKQKAAFLPYGPKEVQQESNTFNTWPGYPMELLEDTDLNYEEVYNNSKTKYLLEHIICGTPEQAKYFISYIAHKLQRPGERMNSYICEANKPMGGGAGMCRQFISRLFGNDNVCEYDNLDKLLERFNDDSKNSLWVCIHEARNGITHNQPSDSKF